MEPLQIITIFLIIVAFAGLGALAFVVKGASVGKTTNFRGLMPSAGAVDESDELPMRKRTRSDGDEFLDAEEIKKRTGSASQHKKQSEDLSAKLFRAGFFTTADKKRFVTSQIVCPLILGPLLCLFGAFVLGNAVLASTFFIIGLFAGYTMPMSWLERQIRARQEDTMYYLPLVVEQISIGVSSSLDIGPCLSQIIIMTGDRDCHNPVTEMFMHVEKLIRSGLNLEEALVEVGEASGQTEVKHAFLFLAQCAKHGGELSKQLQELADAVMTQRQMYVEGRIASLPVKATGPLAMVFAGFFGLLFSGLLVRLMEAFGGATGSGSGF